MLKAYALKLKKYDKYVSYYLQFIFLVFWGAFGFEFYFGFIQKTEGYPWYFFFTFGGGIFAITFYLTIVYSAFLNAFHPDLNGEINNDSGLICMLKQASWCVMGLVFLFAAVVTPFSI